MLASTVCDGPTTASNGPYGESPALISAVKPGVSVDDRDLRQLDAAAGVEHEADARLREGRV